jgi:outer membrane protein insertion porin family
MPKTFFSACFDKPAYITLAEIKQNLKIAYQSGYLKDAWAELSQESTGFDLQYHLEDNPRMNVVRFDGPTIFNENELRQLIESRPGMILNFMTLERDRKTLEGYYLNAGYSLVRVTTSFSDSTGILVFCIDEGRINRIKIEGAVRTRDWVITRHIPFRPGEIYRQNRAERAIDDIFGTGLFETAKILAVPDSVGITLLIKVIERPYNFIRGGARFDIDYGSEAFFDFVAGNLFGGGQELYLSTAIGEKKRGAALNIHIDRIFKTLFTNSMTVDYCEFKRNHYENHKYERYFKQISYGAELAPGRQIPQLGTISIFGRLRQYNWFEPQKAERQAFAKISFGLKSVVDTRNALSFPDRGKYHTVDIEFASDIHNEKKAYTRFWTSLQGYYPLTKRLNFHAKLAVGASSDFMPYFDEFSMGGLHSLLGLHEDEYLGDKLFSGSLDFRQKFGDRTYFSIRYDMGDVWNKLERVKFSTLMYGGGIGLGFRTPIGPIEAWYGRTSKGLDAFYFDVGYDW